MPYGPLPLLFVGVFVFASCGGTPTAPGTSPTFPPNLATSIALGGVSFQVNSTYFWRDWMPIVQKPGPDGGSPLFGAIKVGIDNASAASRMTLTCTVRDVSGKSYPAAASLIDLATGKEWDGTVPANGHVDVYVSLHDGPYLPLNSKVFAVLTWTDQAGRAASMRTPEGQINGTT